MFDAELTHAVISRETYAIGNYWINFIFFKWP